MSYDVLKKLGSVVDGEVVVKLADGWSIRSGVYKPRIAPNDPNLISGEYVRLCDPEGVEYLYYDQAEWEEDPAVVVGAFINVAAGLRGFKQKVVCNATQDDQCPNKPEFGCKGYHYE